MEQFLPSWLGNHLGVPIVVLDLGVRDFDGGGLSEEVDEDEQLGGAVATGERVDLVVVGEKLAEVAVRDGGLGAAQLDQPPVVVKHRVVVGDLGPRVDPCMVGIDRDPRRPGGEAGVFGGRRPGCDDYS